MASQKSDYKLALLGHGDLAFLIFTSLERSFTVVDTADADCIIVANYGKILSKDEISRPKFGAVNIHPSLLPKYRGPTPVQTAIENGDVESGYTIYKLDDKIDHGEILFQGKMLIGEDETTDQFFSNVAKLCSEILPSILIKYFTGNIVPTKQDDTHATFTNKIKDRIIIDKIEDNIKVYNLIRAYGKEPGVFVNIDGNSKLKIITANFVNAKIVPTLVQREGGKQMSLQEFLKGYYGNLPF